MRAGPSFLSAVLVVVGMFASSAAGAGPTKPDPEPALPSPQAEQKMLVKPKALRVMEVAGAQLYVSNALRVFIVAGPLADNPAVDTAGLYDLAKRCVAGQGCGQLLTTQQANSLYSLIEQLTWDELKLDNRLAAITYLNGYTLVFTDARGSMTTAVGQLFARGGVCTPFDAIGAQPQCPPGPLPPRLEWVVNEVIRGFLFQ